MGDLSALEILNPKKGAQAAGQPADANIPPAPQQGGDQTGGQLDPAMVQGLVSGIQALRQMGFDDNEIIDVLMQAISAQALQISEEQVRQIVESVPQSEQSPAAGVQPPEQGGTPPQGTPNITPGG